MVMKSTWLRRLKLSEDSIRERFGSLAFTSMHTLCASPQPTHIEMITGWLKRGLPLLRELKPDFVIVNGGLPIRLPYPSCIISHDLERRGPYGSFIRKLYKMYSYRKVDRIVATCSELREALAREIFVCVDDIIVIPTCIDIKAYRNSPLEAREPAILHVGTSEWKNPKATIDAFARLTRPATLYVVGNISAELKEQLALLPEELSRRISLLGIVRFGSLEGAFIKSSRSERAIHLCDACCLAHCFRWTCFRYARYRLDQHQHRPFCARSNRLSN